MTKFLNISTDTTLGGNAPSDETVSSQKAIKAYVDNHGSWTPPSQTGNAGKFLTTDGTNTSWGIPKSFNLFDSKWSDYLLIDQNWLRADTFSWQDGTVYSDAYNHLVADYQGGTSTTETIGSYTITYVLASDGHKITTDEATVLNIYNATGIAWYYVLDTTNQRFKLPRTKYSFTGLRDTVGNYVAPGLPNITGILPLAANGVDNAYAGAFYAVNLGKNTVAGYQWLSNNWSSALDASLANSIYGNSSTVQPPATQMYLYFYVGQFSQTATEQTAGLNSELFNGKADIDLSNLTATGKYLSARYSMPSNTTVSSITVGANGATYAAPANGYFMVQGYSTATGGYYELANTSTGLDTTFQSSFSGNWGRSFLPVSKSSIVSLNYSSFTFTAFSFVYAEGDV